MPRGGKWGERRRYRASASPGIGEEPGLSLAGPLPDEPLSGSPALGGSTRLEPLDGLSWHATGETCVPLEDVGMHRSYDYLSCQPCLQLGFLPTRTKYLGTARGLGG